MKIRVFGALVGGFLLLPANVVLAACEFNGRGVVHTGLYSDQWESSTDLAAFNAAAGTPITFGGTFHHLFEGEDNTVWILDQIWQAGATPVANVEAPVSAADMASGEYDEAIIEWASGVRRWLDLGERRSVIIAPMQEMNGDWVRWGVDPPNFVIAYRRFVEVFREMGIDETQVRWMFAPNAWSVAPYRAGDYWPGEDVVDVVGLSAYNFGHEFGVWDEVDQLLNATTEELRGYALDKPFLLAQVGSSQEGGDREEWLSDMFNFVASHHSHIGFVYFNFDKETNWRVWDGTAVAAGWIDALGDERVRYQRPLENWFRQGRIPFELSPGTAYPLPSSFCWTASVPDPPSFSDVPDGQFYSSPVSWLALAGLATGFDDGTFRPDEPVTRAEAMTLVWRLACRPVDVPPSGLVDASVDDWFAPAVDWGVATEIALGYPDGTFRPYQEISRAELSAVLWRLHGCSEAGLADGFTDVPVRSFYEAPVGWLIEGGITTGIAPGEYGSDRPVTRGELATLLFRMPKG